MRRNPETRMQREIAVRQPIQQNALSPSRQTNMEIQSPALQQPHEAYPANDGLTKKL